MKQSWHAMGNHAVGPGSTLEMDRRRPLDVEGRKRKGSIDLLRLQALNIERPALAELGYVHSRWLGSRSAHSEFRHGWRV